MKYIPKRTAVLMLEDGKTFYGKAAGVTGTTTGEICFNTGMTGYQEIFTDPSYYGQIVVMTSVHIGNYGVKDDEVESGSVKIAGLVCKRFSDVFSRPSATSSLNEYFVKNNIVAISDIDTRALVRYIRDRGAMNAIISSQELSIQELKNLLKKVPSMAGLELSSKVSAREPYFYGSANASYKVAVLDLGIKMNILRSLEKRNCYLNVFPMQSSIEEMMAWDADGFMISNGPGDPAVMTETVKKVKAIIESGKPVFGICLGHQLIAEASGLNTFKMHKGHRGINHPVKNLATGKCEVTSQNHGFGVKIEDIEAVKDVKLTHINLNDNTVEGIKLRNRDVFSVQYHPEAFPGPHDASYLFDEFIDAMHKRKASVAPKKKAAKTTTH